MKYSQKELGFIVEQIAKQEYALTDWEKGFFASVKAHIENGIPLSDKQHGCLSRIWDKLT